MVDFKLSETGDIVIDGGDVQLIEGHAVTCQTVRQVLSTNKGEWVLNKDEGINFDNIIGKHGNAQPKNTGNDAMKAYYTGEIRNIKQDENALAQKLRNRLEGVS